MEVCRSLARSVSDEEIARRRSVRDRLNAIYRTTVTLRIDGAISVSGNSGGRPDLAGQRLREVRAPTLLIVGGRDDVVIELNR
jgi:hypothetical protein